jgi:hypothetical protein
VEWIRPIQPACNRADFLHSLDEVKPAFGVSEEELSSRIPYGVIHYSATISEILREVIKGKPESIAIRAARAVLPLLGGP